MPRFTTIKSIACAWTGTQRRFEVTRPTPCSFKDVDVKIAWAANIEPIVKTYYTRTPKAIKSIMDNPTWNSQVNQHYGEFIESSFGADAHLPLVRSLSYVEKPPSSYKEFKRRQANGEIVLNPMQKTEMSISCYKGASRASATLGTPRGIKHTHPEIFERWPLMSTCPTYGLGRNYGDYLLQRANPDGDKDTRFTYDVWTAPTVSYPLGNGDLDAIIRNVRDALALYEPDTGLVTATRAESNEKILDLSTSLAEAPETIASLIDVVKIILVKYLECRRQIRVLKRNVIGGKPPVDLIAEVWLRFRYEVLPNIYTIEDTLTYLDSEVLQYMTTRQGDHIPLQVDSYGGWTASEVDVFNRCYIKNRFETTMSKARQGLGVNVGTTFWEIVPLSFVVDWVFNIGELIASLGAPSGSIQEAAMYSERVNGPITFTNPLWAGSPVVVDIDHYRASVIQPEAHVGFNIQLDLNWKRKTDAAALLWLAFKGEFRQTLRKLK